MNRKAALAQAPSIGWNEDVGMLEDYQAYLAIYENYLSGHLKIANHFNRYIYIYNTLNSENVTSSYHANRQDATYMKNTNEAFVKSISGFQKAKDSWHRIHEIPAVKMEDLPEFKKTVLEKVVFVHNTLTKHYMERLLSILEDVYTKKDWDTYAQQSGVLMEKFEDILNLKIKMMIDVNTGVAYFNLRQFEKAKSCWNIALHVCTDEAHKQVIKKNLEACAKELQRATTIENAKRK
jgi:tetratricopeptide (TPR) repeat protein